MNENTRMQTGLLFRKCYLDKCFKRNIFCVQNSQCWVQLSSISTHQCLREDTGRVQLTCQELQKCLPSRARTGPDEKNSLRPDMGLPSLERCSFGAVKGRTWSNLPLTPCPLSQRGVGSRHHGLRGVDTCSLPGGLGKPWMACKMGFHQDQPGGPTSIGSIRGVRLPHLMKEDWISKPQKSTWFPHLSPHTLGQTIWHRELVFTQEKQKTFNSRHILHGHTYGQTVRLSLRSWWIFNLPSPTSPPPAWRFSTFRVPFPKAKSDLVITPSSSIHQRNSPRALLALNSGPNNSSDPLWYHSPAPSPPAHTPTIEAVFIHIPSTQNFAQAPSALPIAPTLVFFIPIHLPHHSSNATSSRKPPLTSLPIPSYTLSVCDYLSLAPIHMIVGLTSYNYAIAL